MYASEPRGGTSQSVSEGLAAVAGRRVAGCCLRAAVLSRVGKGSTAMLRGFSATAWQEAGPACTPALGLAGQMEVLLYLGGPLRPPGPSSK